MGRSAGPVVRCSAGLGSGAERPIASALSAASTPGPARVGHDGDARPRTGGRPTKPLHRSNISSTVSTRIAPHYLERSVVHGVGARQEPVARAWRAGPPGCAGLDDHERLHEREGPHRVQECRRPARSRCRARPPRSPRVFGQIRQQVDLVEVGAVAVAQELREAQSLLLSPAEHRTAERAALRDEGHGPGRRACLERGKEAVPRVDDARAVGADDADPLPARDALESPPHRPGCRPRRTRT